MTEKQDKGFIEKQEKIRIIFQQQIGLNKILERIKEKYRTKVFQDKEENEILILVEEKDE